MAADADVVIIGAGAAGIAAARRLAASHLSTIVLEATAGVGGRAWTCDVAGLRRCAGWSTASKSRWRCADTRPIRRGRRCREAARDYCPTAAGDGDILSKDL